MFVCILFDDTEMKLLQPHYAEELFSLVDKNREYLRAWLPWVDGTQSVSDIVTFIDRSVRQYADDGSITAGIFTLGSLVGVISVTNRDSGLHEIGYWLDYDHQGKGIMTTACKALIDFAFGNTAAQRIDIRVEPDNHRSRTIPERLGFVCQHDNIEPTMHSCDLARNLMTYVMLKDAWRPS